MKRSMILLLAAGLAQTACSGSATDHNDTAASSNATSGATAAQPALSWNALPEDSQAAVEPEGRVMRCWRRSGQYDCVVAGKAGETVVMARRVVPTLPARFEDLLPFEMGGYACDAVRSGTGSSHTERVFSTSGVIKANSWSTTDFSSPAAPMSDEEIDKVLASNGIGTGFRGFMCAGLGNKILETSLAALASTEVTYEDLVGEQAAAPPPAPVETRAQENGFTVEQQRKIDMFDQLNNECRGGTDQAEIEQACERRDAIYPTMKSAGVCWGTIDDESEADKSWHRCNRRSIALQPE